MGDQDPNGAGSHRTAAFNVASQLDMVSATGQTATLTLINAQKVAKDQGLDPRTLAPGDLAFNLSIGALTGGQPTNISGIAHRDEAMQNWVYDSGGKKQGCVIVFQEAANGQVTAQLQTPEVCAADAGKSGQQLVSADTFNPKR